MGTPGITVSHLTNMKVFLLFAAVGFASADVTCDECKAAAAGLVDRLLTPESIEEQTGILIATVCPGAPDPASCEMGMTKYWGDMAGCLYPEFIGNSDVCIKLGLCKKSNTLVKDWTCEDCTAIMTRVAEFIKDLETIEQGIAFLQGECFCGQPGHTEDCSDLVTQSLPPTMEVLSGVLMETTPELCQDVVGVC